MKASDHVCAKCGAQATHRHHRKMRSRGGTDAQALVPLCTSCHSWVHANPAESGAVGLLVASWEPEPTEPWQAP